ncbi:MAG: hypothetical protein GY832_19700 [Chloroflexi bacterium]|nr:hypothetical protein [Chloroflexota bacterium]
MKESPSPELPQTLGARVLQLLSSLFAGLFVGSIFGVLVLVVSGIVLVVYIAVTGGGESILNMALIYAVFICSPAALIVTLIAGLIASVIVQKMRARQSAQANRVFTISCLGIVAVWACLIGLRIVGNVVFARIPR